MNLYTTGFGLRMGLYVPTPQFLTISGGRGIVIYQILDMSRGNSLSFKSVLMVDGRFELTTNEP